MGPGEKRSCVKRVGRGLRQSRGHEPLVAMKTCRSGVAGLSLSPEELMAQLALSNLSTLQV